MTLHSLPDEDAPFKMKAKRDGHCAECEAELFEGDQIYWDPKNYKAYCLACGEEL